MSEPQLVYEKVLALEQARFDDEQLSEAARAAATTHAELFQQVKAILPDGATFATAKFAYTRQGDTLKVTRVIPATATLESLKGGKP